MSDVLARILEHKRSEVETARSTLPLEKLRAMCASAPPPREFYAAVAAAGPRPNLIAEIKRRSPSRGEIRPKLEVGDVARQYQLGGASALSVLTDREFFGGLADDLRAARAAVELPVLRKDFVIEEYQLYESRAMGADAILLIGEALPPAALTTLGDLAVAIGLSVLVEVHSRETLTPLRPWLAHRAADKVLLGINNRDLRRQKTDLSTFEEVAAIAPPGFPLVAESGIFTHTDAMQMHRSGARAMLVGESLLSQPDLAAATRSILGS